MKGILGAVEPQTGVALNHLQQQRRRQTSADQLQYPAACDLTEQLLSAT